MSDENAGRTPSLVPSGADVLGRRRRVFGLLPIDMKVLAAQTEGGLLVLEQIDDRRGGPPRHVHDNQDEWFDMARLFSEHGMHLVGPPLDIE